MEQGQPSRSHYLGVGRWNKDNYPLEMDMKQDYQTLRMIYLLIDRMYYFNRKVARKILDQISKVR